MQSVHWPELFKEIAPFIPYTDRNILLEVSGTNGVSPALLLTAAIYYKNEKKISFRNHIEGISSRLMSAFYSSTNRTNEQKQKENDGTRMISLFVNQDAKQMNELIAIFKAIKKESIKYSMSPNELSAMSHRIKRGEEDETTLRFPFKMSECWMLSATHHSNEHCFARSCPKSSIDLAPNLFMGFGYDFSYFNSNGEVIAAHSGFVYVHSPCKLQVKSNHFTTFYSHITIGRTTGEYVRAGDHLGFIELQREAANCNCEVQAGKTECSTGPHLHWEVRDPTNRPMDLDQMVISGFRVYTGTESYDFECGPDNCRNNMTLEEIESSCSTVFLKMADNTTFCPSVQGANWGTNLIFLSCG